MARTVGARVWAVAAEVGLAFGEALGLPARPAVVGPAPRARAALKMLVVGGAATASLRPLRQPVEAHHAAAVGRIAGLVRAPNGRTVARTRGSTAPPIRRPGLEGLDPRRPIKTTRLVARTRKVHLAFAHPGPSPAHV